MHFPSIIFFKKIKMKIKIFLILNFLLFIISFSTLLLILNFLDPYSNTKIAIISVSISFVLTLTSFLTFIIYFFKKIYYRWEVYLYHLIASFRQSFFLWLISLWILFFIKLWILSFLTIFLLFIIFLFIELLIQNFSE